MNFLPPRLMAFDLVPCNRDKVQVALKQAAEMKTRPDRVLTWPGCRRALKFISPASHINDVKNHNQTQRHLLANHKTLIMELWDNQKLKYYFRVNWTPLTPLCLPPPPPPTLSPMTYPYMVMCNVWHRRQQKLASEWSCAAYLQTPTVHLPVCSSLIKLWLRLVCVIYVQLWTFPWVTAAI